MRQVSEWYRWTRKHVGRKTFIASVASIFATMILLNGASAQEALSKTAGARGSMSLARFVPRRDLFWYLEFQGLDAHAVGWRKTAAYRLLHETKLGALLEDLAIQALEFHQEAFPTKFGIKGVEVVDAVKWIARDGFVFALSGKPTEVLRHVVILKRGDRPEIKRALRTVAASRVIEAEEKPEAAPDQNAGRTIYRLGRAHVWW